MKFGIQVSCDGGFHETSRSCRIWSPRGWRRVLPGVIERGGLPDHQASRFEMDLRLGQRVSDALMAGDGGAPDGAFRAYRTALRMA
jgi:hypothetical protein